MHRLDQWVSGVVCVARGADAAAWLHAAFARKSQSALTAVAEGLAIRQQDGFSVQRTYDAVVMGSGFAASGVLR